MYMQKGNTFFPQGDGGFINYSFNTDGSCTHTGGKILFPSVVDPMRETFTLQRLPISRFENSETFD